MGNVMSNSDARKAGSEIALFEVYVASNCAITRDTFHFVLTASADVALPSFTPGSHVTVVTPTGVRRNYSLCGDPADTSRYEIAVKRDGNGRGGSKSMADEVHPGTLLMISAPRNNFELSPRAKSSLFVAGGIGITPILSMMRHLKGSASDHPFRLVYCTRDAEHTAFSEALHAEFPGLITIHHDQGAVEKAFDFWPQFEKPTSAHVYCCGPKGLMESVADMTGHWPSESVHFESFGVDAKAFAENTAFSALLKRSGQIIVVSKEQTLLQALRANGCVVRSSCESGTCGSCKTGLIAGEVEHRDMVLTEQERVDHIMPCVSRAKSDGLVLDL